MDSKIKSNQSYIDNFFNFKSTQDSEQKNYLLDTNKNNLFSEVLKYLKQKASNLATRTIFNAEHPDDPSHSLQQYNIALPWKQSLIIPANFNQDPYLDYIIKIEEQLQDIEQMSLYSNTTLENTMASLHEFFDLLQKKINFYNINYNNSIQVNKDILLLILKTNTFLKEFNILNIKKKESTYNLITFIKLNTILIYACPEVADTHILEYFLKITNNPTKFKLETIYQHLKSYIFNNNEAFNLSISTKPNFESIYTFRTPKLAAFFLAINYNIKTDKHSVEKIIRRYDEFNQKISDFFLHVNQVMYDKNIIFSDLSEINKQKIIECSAKSSKILAEHELLLEKANFSYLLSTFDSIIGGFFNSLNEKSYSTTQFEIASRTEDKRHLLLIADDLINSLYSMPQMLTNCLQSISPFAYDKKTTVTNIMQTLRKSIADKILLHLNEHIMDLDHNFSCNKLATLPIKNASNKVNNWREISLNSLRNLDNNIMSDDFMVAFNEKIEIRKAILKGFSEIIEALYQELGNNEHFLYDYCVAELINQVSRELQQEQTTNQSMLAAEKLATAFKTAYHSISHHIAKAQEEFSAALLANCVHFFRDINTKQPTTKTSINNKNNLHETIELQQLKTKKHSVNSLTTQDVLDESIASTNNKYNKTTLEQMEKNKHLLGTLICAYTDSNSSGNTKLSLIENLINDPYKSSKKTKKYATNIHKLTFKQIQQKINGRSSFLSAPKVISENLFRPDLSRDKTTLVPAENIRKKNYILMQDKDHTRLKNLCQYALQQTKLAMQKLFFNEYTLKKLDNYLDCQIKNIGDITETRIINPMKWIINALNTIYKTNDEILKLKDDLQLHFNSLSNDYNNFLKTLYNKECSMSWINYLKEYLHSVEDKSFAKIINNTKLPEDKKFFIVSLFKIYDECFTTTFDSILAKKLPPSLETVLIYQKIMAFHLGSFIIKSDTNKTANDKQIFSKFKTSIIHYNDHLKSLTEQMAFKLYRSPDRHAEKLEQLEQTCKQSYRILQDKSLANMILAFNYISSNEDTNLLMENFNRHLDKLFELNFFEKYFGKQSRIFNTIKKIINYCSKNSAFIPGAFVAAAVVNMFFTIQGTELLRNLQKNAPKLFNAIISMKQIFSRMETLVPGLAENASILYAVPLDASLNASSCSADIYKNINMPENISFTGAANSAENNAVSFLQSLYYKDAQDCPSGGSDSFPPGSFVNWPNAITTFVSISSGAIACFSGWAQDVDNYIKGIKEYSSLPNIFQDFSPAITEKLLLVSAKQLPSHKKNTKVVYPGAKTVKEFCLDNLDTLFNKTPKYISRLSPMYALNWSIWALRYMTCGAFSMAIPKRPHSLNEFKERVCVAASDRKFKTLIRMLGYNSAKEFIDVFSTKSGTLAFLLFLKEADFFEAINEKAGISDYQVMKSKYDRFIWSMDVLSKNTRCLNSYQVKLLKETYGSELIDNLIDYNNISEIEKSIQTHVNAMLHRIAGITSLGLIYAAQCANLYYYTFTPWHIAQKVVDKLQGKSVSLSDSVFNNVIAASKKTIKREYTPNNLSFEQQFWHYIFAERASTKFEQSFLLWGIKETINLSMYLNATGHERNMGINTINWELLGCLVAYLLKDSTGMCARFATLLDNESLRTFFSLLDKLDSPLAEKVLSEIGRFGLNSPQSLHNTINSMMEEVVFTSTGDINDIHRIANNKYQEMERIGITTFKKISQLQEQEIEKNLDLIIDANIQDFIAIQKDNTAKKSQDLPPYFQISASNLRHTLQQKIVAHGKTIAPQVQQEVNALDDFMQSKAYNIDYSNPLSLMHIFSELQDKVSASAVDALLYQKIISKVRCIQPYDKTQLRLQSLAEEVNRRFNQHANDQNIEIVIHQP
jgi:hypothetical protein